MDLRPRAKDVASIWRPADLPELTVLHARYYEQRFPRHVHGEYVIGVNEGGAHSFYCRGAEHAVPEGTIALINPGDVHTGEPLGEQEWNYRGFYPGEQFLRTLWEEATHRIAPHALAFTKPVVVDPDLASMFIRAGRSAESQQDALRSSGEIVEVVTMLLARYCEPIPEHELDRITGNRAAVRAREYIHAHATSPISLHDLAAAAETSRFGMLRAFRRQYGMAPYQYVIALRIAHAQRLLREGRAVSTTAAACGFVDQSHMHRHFRRVVGVTPGAYARAVRNTRSPE